MSLLSAFLLFTVLSNTRKASRKQVPIQEMDELFDLSDDKGPNFQTSLEIFHRLNDRAKATFMFRFVGSLEPDHIRTLQKYIKQHTK